MSIDLNKLFKEINSLSPDLINKIEDLYPINFDIELLVYKYFGDIPALILRKMLIQSQEKESTNNNQINELLKTFRDISIRLDRIEQALLNG